MVNTELIYGDYLEKGGIINEVDYKEAFQRASNPINSRPRKPFVAQAERVAGVLGMKLLENGEPGVIARIYAVLRSDVNPGLKHHHSQMHDEKLFEEVLKMVE